jgi:hypothetical protein
MSFSLQQRQHQHHIDTMSLHVWITMHDHRNLIIATLQGFGHAAVLASPVLRVKGSMLSAPAPFRVLRIDCAASIAPN